MRVTLLSIVAAICYHSGRLYTALLARKWRA